MNTSMNNISRTTENSNAETREIIINRLVMAAWHITYTALWNGMLFSAKEKQKAKSFILTFLTNNDSIEFCFEEFVQRVLLTRQYLNQHPEKYLSVPSAWLDERNRNGFAGTGKWYRQMLEKRESLPLYRKEWIELGWAVFQVQGRTAVRNFHEWRSYFAEKSQGMMNLFLSTVANQCYWLRE